MTVTLAQIHAALKERLDEVDATVAPGLRPPESGTTLLYDLSIHRDAVMSGALQGFWKGTLTLEAIDDDILVAAATMDAALARLNPKWTEGDVGGCIIGPVEINTLHDTPNDGRDDASRGIRASVPIIFTEA